MKASMLVSFVLAASLLASVLLVGMTSSIGVYNPWYDLDDDGDIDLFDVVRMAGSYSTSGTPFAMKAAPAYDSGWIDIRSMKGQDIALTPNVGNLEALVWFPRVVGKTVEAGPAHRRGLDLSGSKPDGWERTYGETLAEDDAHSVVQTGDGGYVLAGGKNYDFWLASVDANGEIRWQTTFGGSNLEKAYSMIQTSDEGYLLAGITHSAGDLNGDAWLVKTAASGAYEWDRVFGGAAVDYAYDVVQADDGGYVLAGATESFGSGGKDVWIVKTDSAGGYQWDRTYGGTLDDWAEGLIRTGEGGYALACYTESIFGKSADFWLVKTDAAGIYQWGENFGGPNYDYVGDVVQTSDGGYALVGQMQFGAENPGDVWLVKTDSAGNHLWNRTYDRYWDGGNRLVQTRDGGYAIGGITSTYGVETSDAWLLKTDAAGNLEWDRVYGGPSHDYISWLAETADGGYVWAGSTAIVLSEFDWRYQAWLVKTDAFGLVDCSEYGLSFVGYTADTITFYRGKYDPYWNYVRVTLWVTNDSP